ncbi:hypothetical protein [Nocardia bovistercoris]|uniref:DUF1795 domain-containing protein n=1 Tax=Nocardia bovistercoris TaxID=2785916 RepID=A0A931N0E5_9NOCA|nr:hypothetical protein [Nocardia bovistercoris]MBH0774934.1 hypothetical protein [Nocardia bovistercoris]
MRRTMVALLTLALSVAGPSAVAAADPEVAAPVAAPYALITLTAIPNGWQERTDLRPVLEVFSDGRAVQKPDAVDAQRKPETPPQELTGTIRPDALQSALKEIRDLASADFGTPATNDRGVQIIDLMPQPPDQDVHLIVYSPEVVDGFGNDQRTVRQRFAAVYRALLDAFVKD